MKGSFKKSPLYLAIVTIMAASIIVLLLIRGSLDQQFPALTQARYFGSIQDVFFDDDGNAIDVPLYLEVESQPFALIFRSAATPVYFKNRNVKDQTPLELDIPEARLRLTGSIKADGSISGTVYNINLNSKGSWTVAPIPKEEVVPLVLEKESEIKQIIFLKREVSQVKKEIDIVEERLLKEKEAISKLSEFMKDQSTLQQRTNIRLEKAQAGFIEAEKILSKNKKEARILAKQLALSERVTDMGNLVSLSRKTIDRENRWLDSMFESSTPFASFDFDSEVEKAKKIIELKNKINKLKASAAPSIVTEEGRL